MAIYVLSYDKNINDDPFERIIEILYNANVVPESIEHPVESTLIFEWEPCVLHAFLNDQIENDLQQLCYYTLAEVLGEYTCFSDGSMPTRNERIRGIINRLNQNRI